jgi:hypothetical protein
VKYMPWMMLFVPVPAGNAFTPKKMSNASGVHPKIKFPSGDANIVFVPVKKGFAGTVSVALPSALKL